MGKSKMIQGFFFLENCIFTRFMSVMYSNGWRCGQRGSAALSKLNESCVQLLCALVQKFRASRVTLQLCKLFSGMLFSERHITASHSTLVVEALKNRDHRILYGLG